MNKFQNTDYLSHGNQRQRQSFKVLDDLKLFQDLAPYNPIMTGTIPIGIDTPESDIDIICRYREIDTFAKRLKELYGKQENFRQSEKVFQGKKSSITSFDYSEFRIEIFAQDMETIKQNAYRHMLIEDRILNLTENRFREEAIDLKLRGRKTEPAFTELLGLNGDPYIEILKLEAWGDEEIKNLLKKNGFQPSAKE